MPDNVFGKALRAARTRDGFSQRKLALKLGASDKYVSQWETGSWVPRGKWLAAIVAYYPDLDTAFKAPVANAQKAPAPHSPPVPDRQVSKEYKAALDALYSAGAALGRAQERFRKAKLCLENEYRNLCAELAGQEDKNP